VFGDPSLDSLVQNAYQQNLSLRVAGSRILEATYKRRIAAGYMFPQFQDVAGSVSANKQSANVAVVSPQLWFSNWDTGFNATWELDFWGRFRRAVEAADAELDASIENYDDVLVLLLAEVSTSYVDYRTFQQQLRYARENVAAQEQSLKIAEDKFKFGAATERDVQQARTVLEQTRALVPLYLAGQRVESNRLCALLGTPPRDLEAELGEASIPSAPPEVAIGIPADLVRRRPDVRRAERDVAVQSARIGIAESELYPHISLSGTFGVAAEDFGNLFDGQRSTFGGIGPAFRWDVLNYGRLVNNVRAQDARFQQLAYTYQQTVLEAGREAEDGIVRFLRSQERARSLEASVKAAARTREITFNQYRQGAVEFTAVFLAESQLAQGQDRLAAAQGDVARSLIALYRALGGGWELRLIGPPGGGIAAERLTTEGEQPRPAADTPRVPPAPVTP
jgi:NodT family efflux transporter outer membrane factor (OMF) lipoprotein